MNIVPILARPGGRAQLELSDAEEIVFPVPILARPGGRAQREAVCVGGGQGQFQSSPDPEAGRNSRRLDPLHTRSLVPILARPGGRAQPPGPPGCRGAEEVPILARPGGRAQLVLIPLVYQHRICSNPRPTRRPGATMNRSAASTTSSLFQSSPDPEAGRNPKLRRKADDPGEFQSSPDPEAGRN